MTDNIAQLSAEPNSLSFDLGSDKDSLRKRIHDFVESVVPRKYAQEMDEREEFPHDVWKRLAEHGYLAIPIEKRYGGTGGDILDMVIVTEELSRRSGSMGLTFFISGCFGAKTLQAAGSERLKSAYLPALARGDLMFSLSLTEPGGGTDVLGAMKTRADEMEDHFLVNGSKLWTTGADVADYLVVVTRTGHKVSKPAEGISVFLVDKNSSGVRMKKLNKIGVCATPSFEVFYENVRVPKDHLIGERDRGFYEILPMLNTERILIAAICIGEAQAAYEDAVQYALQRQAFGRPIGQFQAVQHQIAWMRTKIELSRLITYKAAWLQSAGRDCAVEANMAKLVAANYAYEVTDAGMQILGGNSYNREHDMQRYWRDCRLHRVSPISDEMVLNFLGERSGLPKCY